MIRTFRYCGLIIFILSCCKGQTNNEKLNSERLPNVIFILADDLGYGDLSSYGQQKIKTPNIDKLASQGIKFTQHYSGATVCAPSRSALMTGLHSGHTPIRGNKEIMPEGQYPLPDSSLTLAEIFKSKGYKTGAFGKWGLGYPGSEGDPNNQGFDEFYGYNCQRLAHNYYPYFLRDNQEIDSLTENSGSKKGTYAPHLIHERALQFLEANKDEPFFLFYPSPLPHAELAAPDSIMDKYRNRFMPEKSFTGVDGGEEYRKGGYESQLEAHAAFAAMIEILDTQVGEIVEKVKELGIADNTIIVFTSDNGPHIEGGADPDYFDSNGLLKGYKRDLYEGGIRVPLIISWPGKIQNGEVTDQISAFWDFLPTFSELIGWNNDESEKWDGISLLPTLFSTGNQEQHEFLYWEFHELGGRQAVRQGNWKAVRYEVFNERNRLPELYDLSVDVGEVDNVAEKHPELVTEMSRLMEEARTRSEIFNFGTGETIK